MTAAKLLSEHAGLATRLSRSREKLDQLSKKLVDDPHVGSFDGAIFAAGSYGRLEAGISSDLDVFVVGRSESCTPLSNVRILGAIADINDRLSLPPFDESMRFFKVYTEGDLVSNLGKPKDDTENSFTARMLLMLEGRVIFGDRKYEELVEKVVQNYFRDNKGKKNYRPLFLLNDLLRYWRTLCLNYEDTRSDPNRKWRKKNLNLRFSRLSTVFSTVALLLQLRPSSAHQFLPYVKMTPFERLASSLDATSCQSLHDEFSELLNDYEWFLELKDSRGDELELAKDMMDQARVRADKVANFYQKLFRRSEFDELSRYLVI